MPRILIVEDDLLLVKMYKTKFEHENFEVVTATDGQEALDIVATDDNINLVILDFMMPRMSGLDFLKTIRQNEKTKDLKVMMLSNMSNPAEIEEVKKLGIVDFLVKADHTPSQIVEKIKSYI